MEFVSELTRGINFKNFAEFLKIFI